MVKNNDKETDYEDWWRNYSQLMGTEKTLSLHSGYYEKGIKTHEEAIVNKNKLIETMLDLDNLVKNVEIICRLIILT